MKSCSPLHFQLPLKILLNLKKKSSDAKGVVQYIEPYRNIYRLSDPYQSLSSIFLADLCQRLMSELIVYQ